MRGKDPPPVRATKHHQVTVRLNVGSGVVWKNQFNTTRTGQSQNRRDSDPSAVVRLSYKYRIEYLAEFSFGIMKSGSV